MRRFTIRQLAGHDSARGGHTQSRRRQFALAVDNADVRCRIVREDAGQGREVAGIVAGRAQPLSYCGLALGDAVEIAHPANVIRLDRETVNAREGRIADVADRRPT